MHPLQHLQCLVAKLFCRQCAERSKAELHDNHQFASVRKAYHHVAQQTTMLTGVEESKVMLVGILLRTIAKTIVDVLHKMALTNGQYLIESTRRMKTYSPWLLKLLARTDFIFSKPNLIREAELKFIAVALRLFRTKYRITFRQRNLTNTLQVVHHLLLFVIQLVLVRQNLPFAATTNTIMWAKLFNPAVALLVNMSAKRFGIVVLLASKTEVNNIARNNIRHKNNQVIHADKSLAFRCYILYFYFLVNGKFFLFS